MNTFQITTDFGVLVIGAVGGVAAEILHLYGLRKRSRLPAYISSPFYWGVTLAMILIGALCAWLRYGAAGNSFDIFFTGLATPILLQKILAQTSGANEGSRGETRSLRDFFVW